MRFLSDFPLNIHPVAINFTHVRRTFIQPKGDRFQFIIFACFQVYCNVSTYIYFVVERIRGKLIFVSRTRIKPFLYFSLEYDIRSKAFRFFFIVKQHFGV